MAELEVTMSKLLEKMSIWVAYMQVISDPHICIVMSLQLFVALSNFVWLLFRGWYLFKGCNWDTMDVSNRWLTVTLCMYIWGEPERAPH